MQIMTLPDLRRRLIALHSESTLESLTPEDEAAIRREAPSLPDEYFASLREVGHGSVGRGMYMVYKGPIAPGDVFDASTAADLAGVLLVGDNFAGTHEAYQVSDAGAVLGCVESSCPSFVAHEDISFAKLLERRYAK